jgi:hypothetical protein
VLVIVVVPADEGDPAPSIFRVKNGQDSRAVLRASASGAVVVADRGLLNDGTTPSSSSDSIIAFIAAPLSSAGQATRLDALATAASSSKLGSEVSD